MNKNHMDVAFKVEENSIDPIPENQRHGNPKSLFPMWIGANVNYVVLLNGIVVVALGLSMWQALTAVLVGNLLGCTVLGLASIMGPKTGTAGIVTSRTAFGQLGSYLPVIISVLSVLGWFSINSVVATEALMQAVTSVFKMDASGNILMWVCLIIVLALEIIIAIYGHATIMASEKFLALILGTLFLGLLFFVVPNIDFSLIGSAAEKSGDWKTWVIAVGIIFAYPISWVNFASDYSRYYPRNTNSKLVALYSGGGQFVALTFCEFIGVLFCVAIGGQNPADPISALLGVLPTWYLIPFLFAVMMGSVATNVPNGYTAALNLVALRLPLQRVQAVLVVAAFTLLFRIATLLFGEFFSLYEQWLSIITIWSCPWVAIIIVDFFLRKGNYVTEDIMKWKAGEYWYNKGIFWPGIISFVLGLFVAVLFTDSTYIHGPIAVSIGMDIGFEVGFIVTAICYFILAKGHPTFKKAKTLYS
ncbi:purine-cytosine permease family protein [Clostridium cylindrosporum]|uniref:Permease for cytosine/purines uracil thiamine allantoin n=1 Tax=Clostridium cylindrosporum DSM 605 TaxID=1121307 RepID=A0A0J8DAK9_CLOCY|nr:cytosine permease [Clostridium cylindrosporum]KMT22882.1 permease for cytosine/purines uracil thiamine allantoin [Clostridium cylindrosporum DSM 605]